MTVLSVSDFMNWKDSGKAEEYIFDSDNNDSLTPCFRICMRFHTVSVSRAFRRIMFLEGKNSMIFERVKEVRIHEEFDTVGTVFDIVCESENEREVPARFLAY